MLKPGELEIARNLPADGCSLADARKYTHWLATHHYENFNVVSWLLPRDLHQDFYNLYAYCRWADDLGDEIPSKERALVLLDWWESELEACYQNRASHPVFVALRETIVAKDIPKKPFADLLKAFRSDQVVKRYDTWATVLDYCVYSANPVGRLVLYLCGYRDEERQRLSDTTCTALQLANFWQDVSRDLNIGRIYIPLDRAAAHGLSAQDIVAKKFDQRYVALMKELIEYTRALFERGLPLSKMVSGKLSIDLEMFSRGGLAVLDAIERNGYDTLNHRPEVRKASRCGCSAEPWSRTCSAAVAPSTAVVTIKTRSANLRLSALRVRSRLPMSSATALRATRTVTFIRRFFFCPNRSATPLLRSTPLCD